MQMTPYLLNKASLAKMHNLKRLTCHTNAVGAYHYSLLIISRTNHRIKMTASTTWSSIIRMRFFINGRLANILYRNRSSSATKHFQRKPHNCSDLHCPLSRIVCGTISEMLDNGHTDRPNYSNPHCACAPRVNQFSCFL